MLLGPVWVARVGRGTAPRCGYEPPQITENRCPGQSLGKMQRPDDPLCAPRREEGIFWSGLGRPDLIMHGCSLMRAQPTGNHALSPGFWSAMARNKPSGNDLGASGAPCAPRPRPGGHFRPSFLPKDRSTPRFSMIVKTFSAYDRKSLRDQGKPIGREGITLHGPGRSPVPDPTRAVPPALDPTRAHPHPESGAESDERLRDVTRARSSCAIAAIRTAG